MSTRPIASRISFPKPTEAPSSCSGCTDCFSRPSRTDFCVLSAQYVPKTATGLISGLAAIQKAALFPSVVSIRNSKLCFWAAWIKGAGQNWLLTPSYTSSSLLLGFQVVKENTHAFSSYDSRILGLSLFFAWLVFSSMSYWMVLPSCFGLSSCSQSLISSILFTY